MMCVNASGRVLPSYLIYEKNIPKMAADVKLPKNGLWQHHQMVHMLITYCPITLLLCFILVSVFTDNLLKFKLQI